MLGLNWAMKLIPVHNGSIWGGIRSSEIREGRKESSATHQSLFSFPWAHFLGLRWSVLLRFESVGIPPSNFFSFH